MSSFPLTEKEKHKKRERISHLRQGVMIFMMVIAGLYYVLAERNPGTSSEVTAETAYPAESTEANYTIEGFLPTEAVEALAPETVGAAASGTAANENIEETTAIIMESVEATADTAERAALSADPTAAAKASVGSSTSSADDRINLNTATLEELDTLPGVGPSTAQNIITYREAHGGFAAAEEIMNVKRIGEKTYEKLKDHIKVA